MKSENIPQGLLQQLQQEQQSSQPLPLQQPPTQEPGVLPQQGLPPELQQVLVGLSEGGQPPLQGLLMMLQQTLNSQQPQG
jgi:hypothetical protein